MSYSYTSSGDDIYAESFRIIRKEADLSRFSPALEPIAVRMIHGCGQTDLAHDLEASEGCVEAARRALQIGAPVLCDVSMVATGITRRRLPHNNPIICTLHESGIRDAAAAHGLTRCAQAVDMWAPYSDGAVVAIGNAPTALYRLLELLDDEKIPDPAAIIGIPVGFVGAAESKQALADWCASHPGRTEYLTVHGRRGGSAIVVSALNALATPSEKAF